MDPQSGTAGDSLAYNGGPYGADGAPATNFMSSPAPAHRDPSPPRPNIAPSERPLPPMARFSPTPNYGAQPPPDYTSAACSPDPQLQPPKAAFLEPSSPTNHNFDSQSLRGLTHGGLEKREDLRWKDLENPKIKKSSTWLEKKSQASSKFKLVTWIIAIIALLIIGGLIAKIVTTKSTPANAPAPLKWANGAAEVPTFGANDSNASPTTSSRTNADSNNHSSSSQPAKAS